MLNIYYEELQWDEWIHKCSQTFQVAFSRFFIDKEKRWNFYLPHSTYSTLFIYTYTSIYICICIYYIFVWRECEWSSGFMCTWFLAYHLISFYFARCLFMKINMKCDRSIDRSILTRSLCVYIYIACTLKCIYGCICLYAQRVVKSKRDKAI